MANVIIGKDNFNDLFPVAPGGRVNVKWLADPPTVDPRRISASVAVGGGGGGIVTSVVKVNLAPSVPGNFTVPHGLGAIPAFVLIQMTSGGSIWFQTPLKFDVANLYLSASDGGITGIAIIFAITADGEVAVTSPGIGNFTQPHGLGVVPGLALFIPTSIGAIWFQSPTSFDAANLYLVSASAGVTGLVELFKIPPTLTVSSFVKVALTPSVGGNFTVAHGLGNVPKVVMIRMTSGGAIWLQSTPYDAVNLYLVASDGGITGEADVWT